MSGRGIPTAIARPGDPHGSGFGVLLVGFAYLWRFGYLDWVRSAATTSVRADYRPGFDLSREARIDRPI